MNKDKYGEIINGEETYKKIAYLLKAGNSVIIGWTDEDGTHFDILFCLNVVKDGTLQGGLRWNDLFVSIMRWGAFGFSVDTIKHRNYVAEKLRLQGESTITKFTELLNGIIAEIVEE